MKNNKKITLNKRRASILLAVAASCMFSGCAKVINTVNGLTTFQSTISGSNYPFSVDSITGKLTSYYPAVDATSIIGKGEPFEVSLDACFLRYLQASDPYVLVYSEAWMGSEAIPTERRELQRQILLVKDGVAFNARLPITSIPLLGPVTLGDDLMDVHLSLYVVVLSKNDNEQTVKLLDNLASTAGSVAPQYAMVSGAAAGIGKAIVAQNRDKVEFEHTFSLTPVNSLKGIFKTNTKTITLNNKKIAVNEFGPTLAENKLVVIKGENEHRLVPYENWFHYLSPFNWYGHFPASRSTRFEAVSEKNIPFNYLFGNPLNYKDLPGIPRLNADTANYTLVNLPFSLLAGLLISDDSFMTGNNVTSPNNLTVAGNFLVDDTKENSFIDQVYSDKTHVILSVKRTAGSYGPFKDIKTKFSGHGTAIDGLIISPEQALTSSEKAMTTAFEAVKKAAVFERDKAQIIKIAKDSPSGYQSVEKVIKRSNSKEENLSSADQDNLKNIYWDELQIQSAKRLKSAVDSWIRATTTTSNNGNLTTSLLVDDFYSKLNEAVSREKNYWKTCEATSSPERDMAWASVLQALSDYLFATENTKNYSRVITEHFEDLKNIEDKKCTFEAIPPANNDQAASR